MRLDLVRDLASMHRREICKIMLNPKDMYMHLLR